MYTSICILTLEKKYTYMYNYISILNRRTYTHLHILRVWCSYCCNCKQRYIGCSHPNHWIERDSFDTGKRNHIQVISRCGLATISRLLTIIGLICKRALQKRMYSAFCKRDLNFTEPTNAKETVIQGAY